MYIIVKINEKVLTNNIAKNAERERERERETERQRQRNSLYYCDMYLWYVFNNINYFYY